MKWIKRAIFILFAGFLLFGAFLQLNSIRSRAKAFLIENIESSTGYSVQIDQVRLFPSFQMTARDIVILDDEVPLIKVGHIHLGIYPLDLLKGKLHFSTLHIEEVEVSKLPEKRELQKEKSSPRGSIIIDDLLVEKITWSMKDIDPPEHPVNLKGNLLVDLKSSQAYTDFKVSSPKNPEDWISGDLNFENSRGTLLIQKGDVAKASFEFILHEEGGIQVPRAFAKWNNISVDGKFTLTDQGEINESLFFLVVDDLSQMTPLTGTLFGEATISGNLEKPKVDLYLISDQISGFDQTINKLKLRLSTVDKGLFALTFVKNEQAYTFSSTLTLDQKNPWLPTQMDLRVPLEEIAQLIGWDVADIDGQLLFTARYTDQNLTFRAEVLDALVESFDMGSRFTNIQAAVEGNLDTLTLVNLTAKDTDNGTYRASGGVELDAKNEFPFSFKIQLDQARPFQSDIFQSRTSGELKFSGNLSKGLLEGDLKGSGAKVSIPEKMPENTGSVEVTYINQPEGEEPPTQAATFTLEWPIELDVNYTIADELTIKGGGLSSSWTGKINIGGTLEKLKTKGEIKLDEGKFILRGKTFEFVQGAITFNGDPEKNTNLYLSAEMDLTDLTIQVVLNGPILNPSITLTSTPPMSQRAILSWLLFGKGISDINPMEETQLSRSLRSLLDKVDNKPDVLTRVGDVLGLDQLEIGANPAGETGDLTVKVGKYLTEGTYLSISRNISRGKDSDKDTSCFGIETKLGRHFRFRAEGDTETNGRLNLLWKNDY